MTDQTSAYQVAASTPDPELPMLTIEDLGILRSVHQSPAAITVTITPTYSGCPAMREITADNFNDRLSQFAKDHGVDPAKALASLEDARLAAMVEEDYQDGVARGIAHTPTVLVNGRPFVETFPVEDVAKAIDAELAAAK